LFSNVSQLQKTLNDFFERFLNLEEWVIDKARLALIHEVPLMQHEPPPSPRSDVMPLPQNILLYPRLIKDCLCSLNYFLLDEK